MSDCYPCTVEASARPPPRERVYDDGHWRVAHALSSTLPGWLVVLPKRHLTGLAELADEEAARLGPLLQRLSAALIEVTGATKTYVALFAEAAGFEHLHVHVVPRPADLPEDRRGPRIFGYLDPDPDRWLPEADRDRGATRIMAAMSRGQRA